MHLYESKDGTIHACESTLIGGYTKIRLVWTACGKDVPANQSFNSDEVPTCAACMTNQQQSRVAAPKQEG